MLVHTIEGLCGLKKRSETLLSLCTGLVSSCIWAMCAACLTRLCVACSWLSSKRRTCSSGNEYVSWRTACIGIQCLGTMQSAKEPCVRPVQWMLFCSGAV